MPDAPDDAPRPPDALQVRSGVHAAPSINPALQRRRRVLLTVDAYVAGVRAGDRGVLSQAITLIESTQPAHQATAQAVLAACLPHVGRSLRVGITGVPGVGKSTFIETLGIRLTAQGHRLAVLAIDPSSARSKGSILGDKTRMERLAADPRAFIRPSATGGSLGGVARQTRETITLCEAAGYDLIFVETVGVGQSEITVHSMVDVFVLLALAGAGDELQGIKRGIVEMADLVAIHKADGSNRAPAKEALRAIRAALHLYPPADSGWTPQTLLCSSLTGDGIDEVWAAIQAYQAHAAETGFFEARRQRQAWHWTQQTVEQTVLRAFYAHPAVQSVLPRLKEEVAGSQRSSFAAAEALWRAFNEPPGATGTTPETP
ncbi:MAG: methylmalonyl Co-A mutase-associated GTPase MeaB [Bacteroidota bacterium]